MMRDVFESLVAMTAVAAFIFFFPISTNAQNPTGRVIGMATDSQGGSVAGAKVTVTNTGTNVQWKTVTDASGSYQVLDLPVGNYSVSFERDGFTRIVTAAQPLEINQSLRIDVALKPGALAEVVVVQTEAPQVETVNPTIGGTITGTPVADLPLNGRDTLDLALTVPGVTQAPPGPVASIGILAGKFSIAGGRDDAVTYLLNSANNTSVTFGIPAADPNPDTVAEFRILNNSYTAEYGRSAGGVISVVTKSGTNQWHGSVYDYLRNDAFNASDFFDNLAGNPRPVLKRNQFGGTFGGPIRVPKLVNGKDRFFFFFGYQGQRQSSVSVGNPLRTYTPLELTGDFSQAGNNGVSGPATCLNRDPNVAAFLQAHSSFQSNANSAACAIIDPSQINPVARGYIAAGLVPTSATGALTPNGPASDNRNEYLGKFDFNAATNDRISVTLFKFSNPSVLPFSPNQVITPSVPGAPTTNTFNSYLASIGYTKIFSPTMLNELEMSAQRLVTGGQHHIRNLPGPLALGIGQGTPGNPGVGLGILGAPGGLPVNGPPLIGLLGSGLQFGYPAIGPGGFFDTTYAYSDTLTWSRGRHTWKFGGSLGIVQNNTIAQDEASLILFVGPGTGVGSGTDLADFLLGTPDIYLAFAAGENGVRSHQYGLFVQDEWKVTRRLVLTLGLRYEYDTPKTEPHGIQTDFIPGLQSQRFPNAPKGLVFPGDRGAPHGSTFPNHNNWAPRFGFAWDPFGNGKTSIRGGFGVFFDTLLGKDNIFQNGQPPFFNAFSLFFGAPGGLSDPFGVAGVPPVSALPPPQQLNFAAQGFLPFGTPSTTFIDVRSRKPYIYQYNLSVQRQLGNGLAAELNYVGSSSHKLTSQVDENPIPVGASTRIFNNPNDPVPAFGPIVANANVANANYNALFASLTKRIGDWHSIGQSFFTLAYTWSHELDDANGLFRNSEQVPAFNHHLFYASGDSDQRNRLVFSGGWELPFAPLLPNASRRLTAGWSLYPIAIYQSGLPLDVSILGIANVQGGSVPGPSGAGDENLLRPDIAPGTKPHRLDPHQPGNFIFDPSVLSVPACFNTTKFPAPPGQPGGCPAPTYGTLPRNFFPGPDRVNFDLSLEKKTALTERLNMTFRVEAFNLLNHTEWQNPPGGPTLFGGAQVGKIQTTFDPRILQLALRLAF